MEGIRVVLIEDIEHGTTCKVGIVPVSTAQAAWETRRVPVTVERVQRERRYWSCRPGSWVRLASEIQLLLPSDFDEADRVGETIRDRGELAPRIGDDFLIGCTEHRIVNGCVRLPNARL